MVAFNMVDKIFLVLFLISLLVGLFRGAVREVFALLSLLAGLIVVMFFAHPLGNYLTHLANNYFSSGSASGVSEQTIDHSMSLLMLGVSALILFFVTVLIGGLIGRIANLAIEGTGISFFNRTLGGVFGIGRAYLLGLLIIFALQLTPINENSNWRTSRIVNAYQPSVLWLTQYIQPQIDSLKNKVSPVLDNMNHSIQNQINTITIPTKSDELNND